MVLPPCRMKLCSSLGRAAGAGSSGTNEKEMGATSINSLLPTESLEGVSSHLSSSSN